jgi:hypothetical protein
MDDMNERSIGSYFCKRCGSVVPNFYVPCGCSDITDTPTTTPSYNNRFEKLRDEIDLLREELATLKKSYVALLSDIKKL